MKTKLIFTAMAAVCLLAASTWYYVNSFASDASQSLMEENVEALTQNDIGSSSDGRCFGPKIYSDVGTSKGTIEERRHLNDSTDLVVYIDYEQCYADGYGDKAGSNEYLSMSPGGSGYAPCNHH